MNWQRGLVPRRQQNRAAPSLIGNGVGRGPGLKSPEISSRPAALPDRCWLQSLRVFGKPEQRHDSSTTLLFQAWRPAPTRSRQEPGGCEDLLRRAGGRRCPRGRAEIGFPAVIPTNWIPCARNYPSVGTIFSGRGPARVFVFGWRASALFRSKKEERKKAQPEAANALIRFLASAPKRSARRILKAGLMLRFDRSRAQNRF